MIKATRATSTGLERIELENLLNRVGRLFAVLQEVTEGVAPFAPGIWLPPADLCESREVITVRIELPGVRFEQLEVTLTNTHLRVCGEKTKPVPHRPVVSHLCSERSYGYFSRIVPLRWTINVRAATASFCDGVLTVHLPKFVDRRGVEFQIPIKLEGNDE